MIIPNTGIGSVTIEVLPDAPKKIADLRKQIKTILDDVIKEERAEARKIAKEYNKKSYLGKVGENLKAEARGVGHVVEGIWSGIKAIGSAIKEVGEQAGEYILDPSNAPETFKEDVKAVKAKYYELKHASEKAIDIYQTLKDDPATAEMLEHFASEYIDAQHSTELFENAAAMVAGVGLTLITGGAAAAALGTRFAAATAKLAPLLEKLATTLKQKKWFYKKKTVKANTKVEVDREIIREDFLKDPSVPKEVYRGDGRDHNTIFKEGFQSKAPNSDTSLEEYARTNKASKYVGASKDKNIAEGFAIDGGQRDGYLYTIDTDNISGIDVNDVLKNDSPFPFEKEIVYPEIPTESIKGVTPILKDMSYGDYSTINPNYKK